MLSELPPSSVTALPDLAAHQARIADDILAGAALPATAEAVCQLVERFLPGTRVAVRTEGERRGEPGTVTGPGLPEGWHEVFGTLAGRFGPADRERLWPRAACSWREDLANDPAWRPARAELEELDIAACYRVPVLGADGRERAVAFVHWSGPHWPTATDRQVVHTATVLLGLAVERDHAERALVAATHRDPLTDLPNRSLLVDRLRQAMARSRRHGTSVAVVAIDLDRFQAVNDALGHAAGDRLLLAAANRLTTITRPEDTVARMGGDQFTVLSEDVAGTDGAVALGERIADELRHPFVVAQRHFFLSSSIGIAVGGAGSRGQDLLRDAEVAMFQGKEAGRDRVEVFDDRLDRLTRRRLDQEAALRRDLEVGSIEMAFQPVVELEALRPLGLEAMAVWQGPEGAEIEGRALLDLADGAGLLSRLGRDLLERAVTQLRALVDAGTVHDRFPVAVKVGTSQLGDLAFPDLVATTLQDGDLRGEQLVLDVTGAALADDDQRREAVLDELRQLGITFRVEDFGTGHTHLSRLAALPVRGLKVDMAALGDLRTRPGGAPLLEVLAQLAASFGLPVIADRVEEPAQLDTARRFGFQAGQGLRLGGPVPPQELAGVLNGGAGSAG